jgi:hypothetical protein
VSRKCGSHRKDGSNDQQGSSTPEESLAGPQRFFREEGGLALDAGAHRGEERTVVVIRRLVGSVPQVWARAGNIVSSPQTRFPGSISEHSNQPVILSRWQGVQDRHGDRDHPAPEKEDPDTEEYQVHRSATLSRKRRVSFGDHSMSQPDYSVPAKTYTPAPEE